MGWLSRHLAPKLAPGAVAPGPPSMVLGGQLGLGLLTAFGGG